MTQSGVRTLAAAAASLRPLLCLAAGVVLVQAIALLALVVQPRRRPYSTHADDPASKASMHSTPAQSYRKTLGIDPPLGFDAWAQFADQSSCSADVNDYSQIYRDLQPWWNDGIQEDWLSHVNLTFFCNVLVTFDPESRQFLNYKQQWTTDINAVLDPIAHLFHAHKEFKFILNSGDQPRHVWEPSFNGNIFTSPEQFFKHSQCFRGRYGAIRETNSFLKDPGSYDTANTPAPLMSQSKVECFRDILVPLWYHTNIAENIKTDVIPWSDKLNVLFWRGANRGGAARTHSSWQTYQRFRLLDWAYNYAIEHPGITFDAGKNETPPAPEGQISMDIGFHKLFDDFAMDEATKTYLVQRYPLKHEVSFNKTLQFKYLIVVDGHAWPSRFQSYLQTNSVILFNGIFTDFFNWRLKPWVHYVPIRTDFSDLEDVLEWLQKHEDKAEQISKNAQALMKEVNRIQHLQCYMSLVLLEYSRLYEKGRKG
ncbi:glycosyl transferase family 90-domain-containing protein [Chytriomyces sp. MP71]|nr:glycosyl transferase family 90-domain-containing protein [Chytriomyces sp. MP71]